jgi:hypothetical protein
VNKTEVVCVIPDKVRTRLSVSLLNAAGAQGQIYLQMDPDIEKEHDGTTGHTA